MSPQKSERSEEKNVEGEKTENHGAFLVFSVTGFGAILFAPLFNIYGKLAPHSSFRLLVLVI